MTQPTQPPQEEAISATPSPATAQPPTASTKAHTAADAPTATPQPTPTQSQPANPARPHPPLFDYSTIKWEQDLTPHDLIPTYYNQPEPLHLYTKTGKALIGFWPTTDLPGSILGEHFIAWARIYSPANPHNPASVVIHH